MQRTIAIVVYPQVQSLDVTGPLEVFAAAGRLLRSAAAGRLPRSAGAGEDRYEVLTLSRDGAPLRTSSGLRIVPDASLARAPEQIDTLIVAGGDGAAQARADEPLLAWLRERAPRTRRIASVCTGAFVLAAAGLLDGRRATTHWAAASRLGRAHPRIDVDADSIYVRDGKLWTSAGVTAGMDLALALVEEDLDRAAALAIARHLVLFLRRPGSQAQFSATLAAQEPEREPLREAQRFALEHLGEDLSVERLAQLAHMSARNFARAFRAQTGITPGRYVERVRLEAARAALEDGSRPVAAVARDCGFGSPETMRRTFVRVLGVAPAEYRRRFQGAGQAAGAGQGERASEGQVERAGERARAA